MANKAAIPGPYKDVFEGPTPHGGVLMVTFYFDSKYKPIEKEKATLTITHEYDDHKRSIFRTYGTLGDQTETGAE